MVKRMMLVALSLLFWASAVSAEEKVEEPAIHHAPVWVTNPHEQLEIAARIDHASSVKRALLVFRSHKSKSYREVPFKRGEPGPYVAVIPADDVQAPEIAYAIEVEDLQGKRVSVFSTRADPHTVQVPEDGMDMIEKAMSERLDDRRSQFSSKAEFVSFGTSDATVRRNGSDVVIPVDDTYYRIEGGYTYRLLRTVAQFSIRVGVVRGSAPVPQRELLPGQSEDQRFDVGLNYGAPSIRFRLGESFHLDGSFLASVNEVGFQVGTGSALHIGDPIGSKLTLGFEAIQSFGARFYSEVDIMAHERLRVSPIIEVTNMPSADEFGVRLVGEIGVDVGAGFLVSGRGGYQARKSTSGGPSGGGSLSYAF